MRRRDCSEAPAELPDAWAPAAVVCLVLLDSQITAVASEGTCEDPCHMQNERVLFHYNGHGVPRPTANGEGWVCNKSYTQYIPLSMFDLQSWVGAPCIYVLDCSAAGLLLPSFQSLASAPSGRVRPTCVVTESLKCAPLLCALHPTHGPAVLHLVLGTELMRLLTSSCAKCWLSCMRCIRSQELAPMRPMGTQQQRTQPQTASCWELVAQQRRCRRILSCRQTSSQRASPRQCGCAWPSLHVP